MAVVRAGSEVVLALGLLFWYYIIMSKSIKVLPKKRGRPATGRDPVSAIRLSPELRASIDTWARRQSDLPSRSEAIRRLVELGLEAKSTLPLYTKKHAAKAAKIAERHIDPLIDPAAAGEERRSRKRRLIKGPKEFLDVRTDLPKPRRPAR